MSCTNSAGSVSTATVCRCSNAGCTRRPHKRAHSLPEPSHGQRLRPPRVPYHVHEQRERVQQPWPVRALRERLEHCRAPSRVLRLRLSLRVRLLHALLDEIQQPVHHRDQNPVRIADPARRCVFFPATIARVECEGARKAAQRGKGRARARARVRKRKRNVQQRQQRAVRQRAHDGGDLGQQRLQQRAPLFVGADIAEGESMEDEEGRRGRGRGEGEGEGEKGKGEKGRTWAALRKSGCARPARAARSHDARNDATASMSIADEDGCDLVTRATERPEQSDSRERTRRLGDGSIAGSYERWAMRAGTWDPLCVH